MLQPALGHLEPRLRAIVQKEVRGQERIVWAGQPVFRFFTAGVLVPVIFAIPWTAFAIFWTFMAGGGMFRLVGEGNTPEGIRWFSSIFALFGLPFILIGLGMLATPI